MVQAKILQLKSECDSLRASRRHAGKVRDARGSRTAFLQLQISHSSLHEYTPVIRPLRSQPPVVLPRQRHRYIQRCLVMLYVLNNSKYPPEHKLSCRPVHSRTSPDADDLNSIPSPPCPLRLVLSRPRTCVCRRSCRCGLVPL